MKTLLKSVVYLTAVVLLGFTANLWAGDQIMVRKGITVDAPSHLVWKLVGSFDGMDDWHPAVVNSVLVGDGVTPGSRRLLLLPGKVVIAEELLAYSADEMSYSYAIVDSPLPVEGYVSTIQIISKGDKDSQVMWSSTFRAKEGVSDQEAKDAITGVYTAGLNSIKDLHQ